MWMTRIYYSYSGLLHHTHVSSVRFAQTSVGDGKLSVMVKSGRGSGDISAAATDIMMMMRGWGLSGEVRCELRGGRNTDLTT